MPSSSNPILKTPEFQAAWENQAVQDIQRLVGPDPWWSVKSTKKGTLLHAAARQNKKALLNDALPDLAAYETRWPHEQVQSGLLEILVKTNSDFDVLNEWMALGIRWGGIRNPHDNMLGAIIKSKVPQKISMLQIEKIMAFGEAYGWDVWGLGTVRDARMLVLKHVESAQLDEVMAKIPSLDDLPREEALDLVFSRNIGAGLNLFTRYSPLFESAEVAQWMKDKYALFCLTHLKFQAFQVLRNQGAVWPSEPSEAIKTLVLPHLNRKSYEPFEKWIAGNQELKGIDRNEWMRALMRAGKISYANKKIDEWGVDLSREIEGRPLGFTCSKQKTSWLSTLFDQLNEQEVEAWCERLRPIASSWWVSEVPLLLGAQPKRRTALLNLMERHGMPMDPQVVWSDGVTSWESAGERWKEMAKSQHKGLGTSQAIDLAWDELRTQLERRALLQKHAKEIAKKPVFASHVL
jgi:hypothetical protein